jgi:hypothetical protein
VRVLKDTVDRPDLAGAVLVLLFLSDPVIRLVNVNARPKSGILKTKFAGSIFCPWRSARCASSG